MFDTPEQILRQCRTGEDSRPEFREVRFTERDVVSLHTNDLAGELVAFANCQLCVSPPLGEGLPARL